MNTSQLRKMAMVGLALLLMIGGGVWAILSAFTGHFSTFDVVYADVPASGTGISAGSVVIFRDITVGSVASLGKELPNGLLRVELHINPGDLALIPQGVRSDVEIATVFGTQGINLVAPTRTPSRHLEVDTVIPSVAVSQTTTLQGDATDLDNLLNALHPAALDQTLTAIATALKGQGPTLGSTISEVATYLNEMLPQLPTVVHDFELLGPVSSNLATAIQPLLDTLSNGAITAQTITSNAPQFDQLLAGAGPTTDNLTGLAVATQHAFEDLVANSSALLGDIAANPNLIAQTLTGFDQWSKAFATAEDQGPFLSFKGDIVVSGSVQVVAAALGVPGSGLLAEQGLGPQFFNPPTYTPAQCPTYGSEKGPNCQSAAVRQGVAAASASRAVVTTPAQQQAAVRIATSLDKGTRPPSSAVVTLLLEPLLMRLARPS